MVASPLAGTCSANLVELCLLRAKSGRLELLASVDCLRGKGFEGNVGDLSGMVGLGGSVEGGGERSTMAK